MTPPSAAVMFAGDRMMASTLLAGTAAVFPACTVTQCTSVTDRRTLTGPDLSISRLESDAVMCDVTLRNVPAFNVCFNMGI